MELEKAKELNYKEILQNEEVKAYLEKGNENLGILGYTDHSEKHCAIVAKRAGMILSKFGYTEHEIELAEIAGSAAAASLGIRQSPRGERVTLPTLGPSGRQLRLNCWAKNRQ